MIFTSIEAKPKIAFVGKPLEVAIDSGRAKNARKTRLFPSIRKSSRGVSSVTAQPYLSTPLIIGPLPAPSAQFSLTLRVALPHRPGGLLGKVIAAITQAGGAIVAVQPRETGGHRAN